MHLITNYISKILLILTTISFIGFLIPDIIQLSKYWSYSETNYWIIAQYIFILYIILVKYIHNIYENFYMTIINLILYLIIITNFIAIGINIILKYDSITPSFIILSCHIMIEIIIFIIITVYYIFLIIINYNTYSVISYIFDINLYNYGFTQKEISKHDIYIYDVTNDKIEYANRAQCMPYYEAYCNICRKIYYNKEKVYYLGCHHTHIKCGKKMLSNLKECILCETKIIRKIDILY